MRWPLFWMPALSNGLAKHERYVSAEGRRDRRLDGPDSRSCSTVDRLRAPDRRSDGRKNGVELLAEGMGRRECILFSIHPAIALHNTFLFPEQRPAWRVIYTPRDIL